MDLFRRARIGANKKELELPTLDEKRSSKQKTIASSLAFFRRPLRLRGNSAVSIPLGVVILFPVLVVVLILVLFVRHPNHPNGLLMPAGAPPSIRYVSIHCSYFTIAAVHLP